MPANRTSWVPGQSGNPNGRPRRGNTLSDALEAAGTPEELAQLAWKAARDGEPWAITLIYNRLEPVSTKLSISTEDKPNDYDLSRLSPDELKQFIQLAERAMPIAGSIEDGAGAPELP